MMTAMAAEEHGDDTGDMHRVDGNDGIIGRHVKHIVIKCTQRLCTTARDDRGLSYRERERERERQG